MPSANPEELATAIGERIDRLLHSVGRFGSVPDFERRQIARDLDSLAKTDAASGFLFRSVMASLDGDEAEAERLAAKAAALGKADEADVVRIFTLANYGRASAALALARRELYAGRADVSRIIPAAVGAGAMFTVTRLVEESVAAGQVLAAQANPSIQLAKKAAKSLTLAGRTEDELAAMLDVAGDVQREHGLLWLDRQPHIIALTGDESEDSAPGVHYYFRVDVTPREAAEMTGDVGWRLVDRGLVLGGLSVAFVGSRADALSA